MSIRPFPAVLRSATLLVFGALVAACGTGPGPTPTNIPPTGAPPTSEPSQAAVTLLLRVTSEGGFINPSANLASVPTVSVYADGRILTPGAIDAVYPGPLLPPIEIKDVGPAGAQAIVAAIRAAGLDKDGAGGGIGNPDAATTVFAVHVDGTTITSRFHLGGGPGGPGLPGAGVAGPERRCRWRPPQSIARSDGRLGRHEPRDQCPRHPRRTDLRRAQARRSVTCRRASPQLRGRSRPRSTSSEPRPFRIAVSPGCARARCSGRMP